MQKVQYGSGLAADTTRGPSPRLWGKVEVADFILDPNRGAVLFDDFMAFGGTVASNVGTKFGTVPYKTYEDTTTSINQLNTLIGGGIRFDLNAADNQECGMEVGGGNGGAFVVASGGQRLTFEARVRFNQIVTQNAFIGLAEKGLAITDGLISDADAIGDKSLIGFHVVAAASSSLIASHQKNGGGGKTDVATAQTLVAATWYKIGFIFDPIASTVTWFVNGVSVGSITDITVAKFPKDAYLTPFFNLKTSAAAATTMDIDWWRCAQSQD